MPPSVVNLRYKFSEFILLLLFLFFFSSSSSFYFSSSSFMVKNHFGGLHGIGGWSPPPLYPLLPIVVFPLLAPAPSSSSVSGSSHCRSHHHRPPLPQSTTARSLALVPYHLRCPPDIRQWPPMPLPAYHPHQPIATAGSRLSGATN